MNHTERTQLKAKVDLYRSKSYSDLSALLSMQNPFVETYEFNENGKNHQIEVSVEWEDKKEEKIRVVGFITSDKPWWRQFISTNSYGFIVTPTGVVEH